LETTIYTRPAKKSQE